MAGKLALTIKQGATFSRVFTWKVREDPEDSESALVPVDLTGWIGRMQARTAITAEDTLFSLTTENGGITLGGAAGTVTVLIEPEETSTFPPAKYVYDIELEAADGYVKDFLEGKITVTAEVTR